MEKKNIHISTKSIRVICWVVSFAYIALIILQIVSLVKISSANNKLNQEMMELSKNIPALKGLEQESNTSGLEFVAIMSIISLFIEWFVALYVLTVIDSNRRILKDTIEMLNETDIIDKGITKARKGKIKVSSYDYKDWVDAEFYCRCGCQILEDDKECPNCGRKINYDEDE